MIRLANLRRRLAIPDEKLRCLGHLLWQQDLLQQQQVRPEQAAVLCCGLLIYRYASAEAAVLLLLRLRDLLDLRRPTVVSVINQQLLSVYDHCWSVSDGQPAVVSGSVVESHALDLRELLEQLRASQDLPGLGEAMKQLLQVPEGPAAAESPVPA